MKIKISDLGQFLLAHPADTPFFLVLETGEILDEDHLPLISQKTKRLPLVAEVQNLKFCWEYTQEIDDPALRHDLQLILNHIDPDEGVDEFTESLYYHGLEEEWLTYQEEQLQHILADWCDAEDLDYSE